MQTARDLVAVVVELAAGVQNGQHDFGRGLAAGVAIDRNAAAVVDDRDRVVDVDLDVDLVAEAGERLVDRVVDDLVHEVMQPRRPGGADVHRGTLADRLEAFEDLDLVGAVVVRARRQSRCRRRRRSLSVGNSRLTLAVQVRLLLVVFVRMIHSVGCVIWRSRHSADGPAKSFRFSSA